MKEITFKDLWLSKDILDAIEKKGYKTPSSIQAWVIPLLLNWEKDVIGKAQTWTWKTAAFGLPLLERLDSNSNDVQAIILCPTRELAIQVWEEIMSFTRKWWVKLTLLYWWQPIREEIRALKNSPQIVVWTPWRVMDHLNKRRLKIDKLKYFILDEADEMLNVWFRDEIEEIFEQTPTDKRVLLFSATMPKSIMGIVRSYMKEYELVEVKSDNLTNNNITQKHFIVTRQNKFDALCRIIETEEEFYAIVFCRTKADVDEVASHLMWKWYMAEWIHWDVEQRMREKILRRFKEKKSNILVATDVAARWIDVDSITHVVNYSLPENPEIYTHRIWRTGRAWNKWEAITFIMRSEIWKIRFFERVISDKIQKWILPTIEEVISKKKKHLIEWIDNLIKSEDIKYKDIAKELLEKIDNTELLVSALLTKFYNKDLDKENYTDIKESSFSRVSSNWSQRLFFAKWKNDWINSPGDVLNFIWNETGLEMANIWKISIFDNFSFFEAPADEADIITQIFKAQNSWRPLVVKAKARNNWGSSRAWNRWGARWWYRWRSNSNSSSNSSSRWRYRWNSSNSRWRYRD